MEYVNGQTLEHHVSVAGKLSCDVTLTILRQICGALAVAHQAKIVHCDLTYRNVLLAHAVDSEQRVKVIDFGIAKVLGTKTEVTQRLGSWRVGIS